MKSTIAIILLSLGQICVGDVPRPKELILPNPFKDQRPSKLIRPYEEVLGTGIGKYIFKELEGFPSYKLSYYIIDATFRDSNADPRKKAASYIDMVAGFQKDPDTALSNPPIRSKIHGIDCLINDFPNEEGDSYFRKHYVIEFYIPEHHRIYAVCFESLWYKKDKHPYIHKLTPLLMEKAVRDFVIHNR